MTEMDQLIETVRELGPLVAELFTCSECGKRSFYVHSFAEALPCLICGHRNASIVPLYNEEPFGDEKETV